MVRTVLRARLIQTPQLCLNDVKPTTTSLTELMRRDVRNIIKAGEAHGLRGTLTGFLESEVEDFVWRVKHPMKLQNIMHDEKWLILPQSLNVNQEGGSGNMLSRKILKLRSSETCIFPFIFAFSNFSRRATNFT